MSAELPAYLQPQRRSIANAEVHALIVNPDKAEDRIRVFMPTTQTRFTGDPENPIVSRADFFEAKSDTEDILRYKTVYGANPKEREDAEKLLEELEKDIDDSKIDVDDVLPKSYVRVIENVYDEAKKVDRSLPKRFKSKDHFVKEIARLSLARQALIIPERATYYANLIDGGIILNDISERDMHVTRTSSVLRDGLLHTFHDTVVGSLERALAINFDGNSGTIEQFEEAIDASLEQMRGGRNQRRGANRVIETFVEETHATIVHRRVQFVERQNKQIGHKAIAEFVFMDGLRELVGGKKPKYDVIAARDLVSGDVDKQIMVRIGADIDTAAKRKVSLPEQMILDLGEEFDNALLVREPGTGELLILYKKRRSIKKNTERLQKIQAGLTDFGKNKIVVKGPGQNVYTDSRYRQVFKFFIARFSWQDWERKLTGLGRRSDKLIPPGIAYGTLSEGKLFLRYTSAEQAAMLKAKYIEVERRQRKRIKDALKEKKKKEKGKKKREENSAEKETNSPQPEQRGGIASGEMSEAVKNILKARMAAHETDRRIDGDPEIVEYEVKKIDTQLGDQIKELAIRMVRETSFRKDELAQPIVMSIPATIIDSKVKTKTANVSILIFNGRIQVYGPKTMDGLSSDKTLAIDQAGLERLLGQINLSEITSDKNVYNSINDRTTAGSFILFPDSGNVIKGITQLYWNGTEMVRFSR